MNSLINITHQGGLLFQLRHQFRLLLFIAPIFLISGCGSSELSRSQAQKQIVETTDFKNVSAVDLISVELKRDLMRGEIAANSADETEQTTIGRRKAVYFQTYPIAGIADYLGLVDARITRRAERIDIWSGRPLGFWQTDENYVLTDKAKALWADYNEAAQSTVIPTAKKAFIEVTGITKQGETDALVEFSYKWVPNELGRVLDPSLPEFKNLPQELQKNLQEIKSPYGSTYAAGWGDARRGMALFKRFDDGWRIGRISFL